MQIEAALKKCQAEMKPIPEEVKYLAGLQRVPGRPPAVGYFGRICAEKGFGQIIDAFVLLHR